MNSLGIQPDKRMELSGLIDRRTKMKPDAWDANASELGMNAVQITKLEEIPFQLRSLQVIKEASYVFLPHWKRSACANM